MIKTFMFVPYCGCLLTVIAIFMMWHTAGTVQYGFVALRLQ